MSVEVRFCSGALPIETAESDRRAEGAGAAVVFEGVIRPTEDGRAIRAISYDAYRPMADRLLHDLGTQALERFGLMRMLIEHSVGRVEAGRVSFRLTVCAAHRAPALEGMAWFIDRMKEDVPIWKRIEPAQDEAKR